MVAGVVPQQFADAVEVTGPDFLHHEGVGRVQHQAVLARAGLQRLEPGVYVLDREFGFEAFQAAGPGIHGYGDLVDRPAARKARA